MGGGKGRRHPNRATELRKCAIEVSRREETFPGVRREDSRLQAGALAGEPSPFFLLSICPCYIAQLSQHCRKSRMSSDKVRLQRNCFSECLRGLRQFVHL